MINQTIFPFYTSDQQYNILKLIIVLVVLIELTVAQTCTNPTFAFISEFHYKNAGPDEGQFIEIAHCGRDNSFAIHLGTLDGVRYQEFTPYPTWTSQTPDDNDLFYSRFVYSDIRDGPGNIELFRYGTRMDSLTYEDFTDIDKYNPDIVVFESETTPIGYSLQRINGVWQGPLRQTKTSNMTFTQTCTNPNFAFISEFHYKNLGPDEGQFIEIAHCGRDNSFAIHLGFNGDKYQEFTPYPTWTSQTSDANGLFYSRFVYNDILDGPGSISLFRYGFLMDSLTYEDFTNNDNYNPDIVVFESESTPIGYSLQRINGVWQGPLRQTKTSNMTFTQTCTNPNFAFICEFHYKNVGPDEGQFIEIAHCGQSNEFIIHLGTLNDGLRYQEFTPYPTWTSQTSDANGLFYSRFDYSDIRDGPGYINLYRSGFLIDSLSYEDFNNNDYYNPDTVVFESESTPIGYSLQRINGVWQGPLKQRSRAGAPITPMSSPVAAPMKEPFSVPTPVQVPVPIPVSAPISLPVPVSVPFRTPPVPTPTFSPPPLTTPPENAFCFSGYNSVQILKRNPSSYHNNMKTNGNILKSNNTNINMIQNILISELQVGDYVLASKNKLTRVISFCHQNKDTISSYLRIDRLPQTASQVSNFGSCRALSNVTSYSTTNVSSKCTYGFSERPKACNVNTLPALEMSHDHMVYVIRYARNDALSSVAPENDRGNTFTGTKAWIRAKDVKIGDMMIGTTFMSDDSTQLVRPTYQIVTNIQEIRRRGVYAPITDTGSLYVSDSLVSAYVAVLQQSSPSTSSLSKEVLPLISPNIQHWIAHFTLTPIRIICWYDFTTYCKDESYDSNGYAWYSKYIMLVAEWISSLNVIPKGPQGSTSSICSKQTHVLCSSILFLNSSLSAVLQWVITITVVLPFAMLYMWECLFIYVHDICYVHWTNTFMAGACTATIFLYWIFSQNNSQKKL